MTSDRFVITVEVWITLARMFHRRACTDGPSSGVFAEVKIGNEGNGCSKALLEMEKGEGQEVYGYS